MWLGISRKNCLGDLTNTLRANLIVEKVYKERPENLFGNYTYFKAMQTFLFFYIFTRVLSDVLLVTDPGE